MSGSQAQKDTEAQFSENLAACREVFVRKMDDYGLSWIELRPMSLVDKILVKARRIQRLHALRGRQKILEGPREEYVGIVNFCAMAMIQLDLVKSGGSAKLSKDLAKRSFDEVLEKALELLLRKNHDYGEAWREMEITTFADEVVLRVARMKEILRNRGKVTHSEGLPAQLLDTINYAVLAMIRLAER